MTLLRTAFVAAAILATCLPGTVLARPTGITGVYQTGCGGCHGGTANGNTKLSLSGNTTVKAGGQGTFTFRVENGNQTAGGFNLAIISQAGAKQANLAGGAGVQNINDELTHTAPGDFDGNNGANFQFTWTAPAAHGTYTLYAAGNAVNENNAQTGDVWNTMSKTLTVTGATVTAPVGGQGFCVGESTNITWTQTGITTLKIELSKDNFSTTTVVTTSVSASSGSYSYTFPSDLTASSNYVIRLVNTADGEVLSTSMPFTISGAPVVAEHPQTQSVCVGRTLQLVAGATGKSPLYQWRLNGTPIAGATDAIYRVPNATAADGGVYDCVISSCDKQVTTNQATVTIVPKPTITSQTTGNQELCEGENLALTVEAIGAELIYEWYKNGALMPGITTPTLSLQGVSIGNEGTYFCRVSGSCTPADTSTPVVVDVLEKPVVTEQPVNATIKAGEKLTLTVAAVGDKLMYQWLRNGTPVSGANQASFVVNAAARADSGNYRCAIWNACDTVESAVAKVVVNPATGPGQLTLSVDTLVFDHVGICSGADTIITGMLSNTGGTEIVVTSVSTDPPASLQVLGLTAPFVLQPGSSLDVQIRVMAQDASAINGTVTFFAASGNGTVVIIGTVVPDLALEQDTLRFSNTVGERHCTVTLPMECDSAVITAATISGTIGSTFTFSPELTLPLVIKKGEQRDICLESTDTTSGIAVVELVSTAGTVQFFAVRSPVSSVDDVDGGIAGLTVAPNPMSDVLRITSASAESIQAQVYTALGAFVQSLNGQGWIEWDGRDRTGNELPGGMYVVVVSQGSNTTIHKVLMH